MHFLKALLGYAKVKWLNGLRESNFVFVYHIYTFTHSVDCTNETSRACAKPRAVFRTVGFKHYVNVFSDLIVKTSHGHWNNFQTTIFPTRMTSINQTFTFPFASISKYYRRP